MSFGMCSGHKVAALLVWVGALNWGLIGLFDFNLVHALLGFSSMAERVIYVLVGLSAIFMLFCMKCSMCKMGKKM